jgi:hypothetical protein
VRRWAIPAVPLAPGRLLPSSRRPPLDGSGARRQGVAPPRAPALDLAPRPGQDGRGATPWQRSSPARAGRPGVPGPRCRRQARGGWACETPPGHLRRGWTGCLGGLVRSPPRDVRRLAAQGPRCPPLVPRPGKPSLPPASLTGAAVPCLTVRGRRGLPPCTAPERAAGCPRAAHGPDRVRRPWWTAGWRRGSVSRASPPRRPPGRLGSGAAWPLERRAGHEPSCSGGRSLLPTPQAHRGAGGRLAFPTTPACVRPHRGQRRPLRVGPGDTPPGRARGFPRRLAVQGATSCRKNAPRSAAGGGNYH